MAQDGIDTANKYSAQLGGYVEPAVKKISDLQVGQNATDAQQAGRAEGVLGKRSGTVTLICRGQKNDVFTDWINNSLEEGSKAGTELTVTLLNSQGPLKRWTFAGAWVRKYESDGDNEKAYVSFDDVVIQ